MNFSLLIKGQRITATVDSTATVIDTARTPGKHSTEDLMVYNPGPNLVYAICGDGAAEADNTCMPIPAGEKWAYYKGDATHIALLAEGGSQDVIIFLGKGN